MMKNKRFFLISLTMIVIISLKCSIIQKNDIIGNWYACSKDGLYIEMFLKNDEYKFSGSNEIITNWCKYYISNDTLYQQ